MKRLKIGNDFGGPKSFSGPIGIQLSKCEKLPIVNFESVYCEVPDIHPNILRKDQ